MKDIVSRGGRGRGRGRGMGGFIDINGFTRLLGLGIPIHTYIAYLASTLAKIKQFIYTNSNGHCMYYIGSIVGENL